MSAQHKVPPPVELSRRGRRSSARHADYKRILRRRRLIERTLTFAQPEMLLPHECFLLVAGSVREAHAAANAQRRQRVMSHLTATAFRRAGSKSRNGGSVQRPTRSLSRLNRSDVFPLLIPEHVEICPVRVKCIIDILRRNQQSTSACHLLDALATAAGLDFDTSAALLFAEGLVAEPFGRAEIAATRNARVFWHHHNAGRRRYVALAGATAVRSVAGDWGYFQQSDFDRLLPGIVIPGRLMRPDYFTNFVRAENRARLDVYAGATMEPLFAHPFPNEFNPLAFGTGCS